MVEVFSTNITCPLAARTVLQKIRENFPDYRVNFDLEDCDKILRVESLSAIAKEKLSLLIANQGYKAEVLPD